MRTIKFRGKRINRNGEWAYGDLRILSDRTLILPQASYDAAIDRDAVDESTIGQFTGLLDKNGKEIYEGDIVNVRVTDDRYKMDPRFRNGVVTFCEYDGGWMVECYNRFLPKRMEVVGNIHDNPELLKNND